MAIGQEILDKVTVEGTLLGSLIALMQGLIDNGTIPAETGAAIFAALDAQKAQIEAAIVANTPAQP